jgi:hypothetical protein
MEHKAAKGEELRHMKILRFVTDTPVEVSLKYDGGRDVDGRYGPQVLYTLSDDRLMYLERKVARQIEELNITTGELFSICRREIKNGQKRSFEWEVERVESVPPRSEPTLVQLISADESVISLPAQSLVDIQPSDVGQHSNGSTAAKPEVNQQHQAVNGNVPVPLASKVRPSISSTTKLEFALKTAIAAAAGAEQFGHEIGYVVRFAPDDIRAMAITVLINGSRENGVQR